MLLIFTISLLVSLSATARNEQMNQEPAQKPASPKMYQCVHFKLGPSWNKDLPIAAQPGVEEHFTYMKKLTSEGILVLGGPFIDQKTNAFTGAMMIFAANTLDEARKIVEADPANIKGLIQVDEIRTLIITGASWKPSVQ